MKIKERGIYVISDLDAGKCYVGSTKDKKRRFRDHDFGLRKNEHHNKHLQKAYNEQHKVEVLFIPVRDEDCILEVEQALITEFIDKGILYNIARDVYSGGGMLGMKHTPETIAKLKVLAKIRGVPRSTIEAGNLGNIGRVHTVEQKAARSIISKAAMTPAAKEHLRQVNIGIKHTPEDIARMKEICKDRVFTPQAIEAKNKVMNGRVQTAEEIAKRVLTNTGKKRDAAALANIHAGVAKRTKQVIINGITYLNSKTAAAELNLTLTTVKKRIFRDSDNCKDWNYVK